MKLLEYDCRWYRLEKRLDGWLVDERDGEILILNDDVIDPEVAGYVAATIPIPASWGDDYSWGVEEDRAGLGKHSVWLIHPALEEKP